MIGGVLISIICSLLGVFVVQRKMSFLGSGLAHSTLGGVGLALLLGFEPLYMALPFTIVINLLITLIKERTILETDTSIGIMFSGATALGILFLSLKQGYVGDGYSYLFGSILGIALSDVIITAIFVIITLIFIIHYWSKLAYLTFIPELAIADKINRHRIENGLSIILSITIVTSIKLIGIMLISAVLVLPAAIARLYSKTFSQMTILSLIFGISSTIAGLLLSLILNFPSGVTIILLQILLFVVSLIMNKNRV
jgi:zinc transport system permease protein